MGSSVPLSRRHAHLPIDRDTETTTRASRSEGQMTLNQYLEQFIEGYLLEDLRSMAEIRVAPAKQSGAVGYPIVMTVLSGVEVLGVLTSQAPYNENNGAARFGEYWRGYMYPDREAFGRLHALMYEFVRHGLAHAYMTKPMIRVTKH